MVRSMENISLHVFLMFPLKVHKQPLTWGLQEYRVDCITKFLEAHIRHRRGWEKIKLVAFNNITVEYYIKPGNKDLSWAPQRTYMYDPKHALISAGTCICFFLQSASCFKVHRMQSFTSWRVLNKINYSPDCRKKHVENMTTKYPIDCFKCMAS